MPRQDPHLKPEDIETFQPLIDEFIEMCRVDPFYATEIAKRATSILHKRKVMGFKQPVED